MAEVTECIKGKEHVRPVHLNRGSSGSLWLCLNCGVQLSGKRVSPVELNALLTIATAYAGNFIERGPDKDGRWLLYHEATEEVYESFSEIGAKLELNSGQVEDVTGIKKFEDRFKKESLAKGLTKKEAPVAEKRKFKVKKKLSGGQKSYRKWEDYEEGDVVIGTYVGTHIDQYKKECFTVLVIDAQFQDDTGDEYEGKNLVLNSAGMLNKAMEDVAEGETIQVTYEGKSRIEKGVHAGKDSHVIKVELMTDEDSDEDEGDDTVDPEDDDSGL